MLSYSYKELKAEHSWAKLLVWKVNTYYANWTFPFQILVKKCRKQGGSLPFSHNRTDGHNEASRQRISRWKCKHLGRGVFDTHPIRIKGTTMSLQQILSTLYKTGSKFAAMCVLLSKLEVLYISKVKSAVQSAVQSAVRRRICKINAPRTQLVPVWATVFSIT